MKFPRTRGSKTSRYSSDGSRAPLPRGAVLSKSRRVQARKQSQGQRHRQHSVGSKEQFEKQVVDRDVRVVYEDLACDQRGDQRRSGHAPIPDENCGRLENPGNNGQKLCSTTWKHSKKCFKSFFTRWQCATQVSKAGRSPGGKRMTSSLHIWTLCLAEHNTNIWFE